MKPTNHQCTKCGGHRTVTMGFPLIGCSGCLCIFIPPLGILLFIYAVLESIFKFSRQFYCQDCKGVFTAKKEEKEEVK